MSSPGFNKSEKINPGIRFLATRLSFDLNLPEEKCHAIVLDIVQAMRNALARHETIDIEGFMRIRPDRKIFPKKQSPKKNGEYLAYAVVGLYGTKARKFKEELKKYGYICCC